MLNLGAARSHSFLLGSKTLLGDFKRILKSDYDSTHNRRRMP